MSPDTVLNFRLLTLVVCFCAIALMLFFSRTGETAFLAPTGETSPNVQGIKTPIYCMTESSASVVYFTPIYDTKLNQPVTFSSNVIAREFVEYLKGRYDFNTPGSSGRFTQIELR